MTKQYTRREILRAAALGGMMIAGELWIPGQTLISIPASRIWTFEDRLFDMIFTNVNPFGDVIEPDGRIVERVTVSVGTESGR